MTRYQPKTDERCSCKRGLERDNCPRCEGTGQVIDFAAIRNQHCDGPGAHRPGCECNGGGAQTMTRKHFKALTGALADIRPEGIGDETQEGEGHWQWIRDRDAIADVCAAFNPHFDRARFIAATEEP